MKNEYFVWGFLHSITRKLCKQNVWIHWQFWPIGNMSNTIPFIWSEAGLTHSGWGTHICVIKPNITGSYNVLSPGRRQAIIWTNAGILLIGPLGTNFSEILSEIHTFSLKKMRLKMSSGKWRTFCLGLNVLTDQSLMWRQGWVIKSQKTYYLFIH